MRQKPGTSVTFIYNKSKKASMTDSDKVTEARYEEKIQRAMKKWGWTRHEVLVQRRKWLGVPLKE